LSTFYFGPFIGSEYLNQQGAIEVSKSMLLVSLAYIIFHAAQLFLIFPVEKKLVPDMVQFASLMYLPHAVRVLAVSILGPIAFLALFPAMLLVIYFENQFSVDIAHKQSILTAAVGAGCSVLAYYIVRFFSRSELPFGIRLQSWRPVFLIGVIASLLNSIGMAFVFREFFDPNLFPQLILRYFVGDIFGLAAGSLFLLVCLRFTDR
jgi:hypothetical protein